MFHYFPNRHNNRITKKIILLVVFVFNYFAFLVHNALEAGQNRGMEVALHVHYLGAPPHRGRGSDWTWIRKRFLS